MKKIPMLFLLTVLFVVNGLTHDGDHSDWATHRTFKVSKTGEVNFATDVKIGNRIVKRGKYILDHRPENVRHVFIFSEINKKKGSSELAVIELNSRFVGGSERVKNSAIMVTMQHDHSYAVQKIQIAGENGDHLFATN